MVERQSCKLKVMGSIPISASFYFLVGVKSVVCSFFFSPLLCVWLGLVAGSIPCGPRMCVAVGGSLRKGPSSVAFPFFSFFFVCPIYFFVCFMFHHNYFLQQCCDALLPSPPPPPPPVVPPPSASPPPRLPRVASPQRCRHMACAPSIRRRPPSVPPPPSVRVALLLPPLKRDVA